MRWLGITKNFAKPSTFNLGRAGLPGLFYWQDAPVLDLTENRILVNRPYMELDSPIFLILGGALVSAGIGAVIGNFKRQSQAGFWLGLLLGPIGWIIVMLMPETGRQCPECKGGVPNDARKCRHCGSSLTSQSQTENLGNRNNLNLSESGYFAIVGQETIGPYSAIELCNMWRQHKIDGKTLCAKNGDSKWVSLEELRSCERLS